MLTLDRNSLPEWQADKIREALIHAWEVLNVICGKTYSLTPREYFLLENDDLRASLDMKIEHLMEQLNKIKKYSRPLVNGIPVKNSMSFYAEEYPYIQIQHVRSFRTQFAHFYER